MVKHLMYLLDSFWKKIQISTIIHYVSSLLLLLPFFVFSGEFTASVNRSQISMGETLTLTLTLKDASPQGNPSLEALKNSFHINGQQQGSNIIMMNGRISANTTWKITLTPQKEGEAIIPLIKIHTSEGIFASDPIKVNITKGNPNTPDNSDINGLTLTADLSKAKPYKNEPFFYTIKLTSKQDLANVKVQKFNMEDAIVEPNGEPKVYKQLVNGVKVDVVELSYLITPLKAGPLKIPPVAIQGGIPIRRQTSGSFFDDDFQPFFMIPGFEQLQPFMLASKEVLLDVQPAVAGMTPWLPAQSLKIEEIWDESQKLQAGEPIIRGFKIIAEGTMSNQLPSLSDQQVSDNHFKFYADKPETGDEVKNECIHSFRKEQYTLIPQQSGYLTLPEISIAWWDVNKQEKLYANIPARTLQIAPTPESANNEIAFIDEKQLNVPNSSIHPLNTIQRDPLLYIFMTGLAILLFAAIFWVVALQRKIARMGEPLSHSKSGNKHDKPEPKLRVETQKKPPIKDKNEKLPDLNPT